MNAFLLDTNVLLWYFWGSKQINPAKKFITSTEADVYISVISLWEIATKVRAGKLTVDIDKLRLFAKRHAFPELPVTGEHIKAYLELSNLHKDPFDLMLLAQAITCPMRLITGDAQLAEYSSLVVVV
ncbi:MAG: type II toxin-antitoxin system VapC family toxin [Treponema sp.]|jgi:PIN domain nuclease of toxin-antitoxin system|nr:type II toxin-antitoxin system VapC family toxin [Treponema sp.]